MSEFLTREQILAINDLPDAVVMVPGWGGRVRLRTMTSTERDSFDLETQKIQESGGETGDNLRSRLVAACVVDEQGQRLFTSADVTALGLKSAKDIGRVYRIAAQLNDFGLQDEGDAGN